LIDDVNILRSAATIRERCRRIAEQPLLAHFRVDRSRLPAVAQRVATLTRSRFPDLVIPYHSRWRHFEAGGVDRKGELDAALAGQSTAEIARARIDLTVISVLLDAGAGPGWSYDESRGSGRRFARSEGLGVATFRAFMAGRFSSDAADPYRVDAQALSAIDVPALAALFQASDENPLVGLAGRVQLLLRLAAALSDQPACFGAEGRPGALFDRLLPPPGQPLHAEQILRALLDTLSAIWPSGQAFDGTPVGDVWPHPHAGGTGASAGLVPFHKLSQWLTYSLLEPFQWAGVKVDGLDALTGLPEYRNGGLLIDAGVLLPNDPDYAAQLRTPDDPWVVEWRALTVALLDELAPQVRGALGVTQQQLPLACILEGGTWAAGRQIAAELRDGGVPPLRIESDGTVF
jgi:hypothetical protein